MSCIIAEKGTKDLRVVGAVVVRILILLADLPDDLVGDAVEHQRLAEDIALAEQLVGHVEADDRRARHLLLVGPCELPAVLQIDRPNLLVWRFDTDDS
ncbi:MAG: hypothetical protein QM736_24485 [Vicinamibacterales bacterium]